MSSLPHEMKYSLPVRHVARIVSDWRKITTTVLPILPCAQIIRSHFPNGRLSVWTISRAVVHLCIDYRVDVADDKFK